MRPRLSALRLKMRTFAVLSELRSVLVISNWMRGPGLLAESVTFTRAPACRPARARPPRRQRRGATAAPSATTDPDGAEDVVAQALHLVAERRERRRHALFALGHGGRLLLATVGLL